MAPRLDVRDGSAVLDAVCMQALDELGGEELRAEYADRYMTRRR